MCFVPRGIDGRVNAATGKEERICYFCQKKGHIKKDCRKWKREQGGGAGGSTPAAVLSVQGRIAATQRRTKFMGLDVRQGDVCTAFLNGDLTEEVHVRPPPEAGQGGAVWRLRKALHGLKQAARAWYAKLAEVMEKEGFTVSQNDPCLFMRGSGDSLVCVLVHVDDMAVVARGSLGEQAIADIGKDVKVKDLAEINVW